jgi:hypothetical protein
MNVWLSAGAQVLPCVKFPKYSDLINLPPNTLFSYYDFFSPQSLSPVVLYGCETLFLTLREEHRLRVFENRALRRIFGPKRDEVTGGWRKLHNEIMRSCMVCTLHPVLSE